MFDSAQTTALSRGSNLKTIEFTNFADKQPARWSNSLNATLPKATTAGLAAVIANGLDRAAFLGFLAASFFFR